MNRWECQYHNCKNIAIGVGSDLGPRYIGWYFARGHGGSGPTIYCPLHRPDGIPCIVDGGDEACGLCKAEEVVTQLVEVPV